MLASHCVHSPMNKQQEQEQEQGLELELELERTILYKKIWHKPLDIEGASDLQRHKHCVVTIRRFRS